MYATRQSVTVTTASDGSATVYSENVSGRLVNVIYTKNNFTNGVDFTIVSEATGQTIWTEENINASKVVSPRQAAHSVAGVALVYAASDPVTAPIVLASDRVKIQIANGGNATTGTFTLIFE